MNDYEDWKLGSEQSPINDMQVVPRSDWPQGSKKDGLLYTLEADLAMRPLMADNDTSALAFEYDADGAIQWVPVDPNPIAKPSLSEVKGSYDHVSKIAARLNAIQSKGVGKVVTWLYSPAPVPLQGASA